ncbi:MAG: ATP-binding protein [Nitrospinales bacterium]
MRNLKDLFSPKENSPFNPGKPVPLEHFVGREEEIARILRAAGQVVRGRQENIFITGERGIGKSSLASYVRYAAQEEHKLAGFHVLLGGAENVEQMAEQVISQIIEQTHQNRTFDKVKSFLGKYVQELGLFGVKLNMKALRQDAPGVAYRFLPFLRQVYLSLKEDYKGLVLILDDLNGITRTQKFAALLKSMVDEIAVSGNPLPLLLILIGVPERREEILEHQRSVERIFDIVEINPLKKEYVKSFFINAFKSVGMSIESDALDRMVLFSGGLPNLMHELGDAVFWEDRDDNVDRVDAIKGTLVAADSVGRKYFSSIYKALRSTDYHSILNKLGAVEFDLSFEKSVVEKQLTPSERNKFNNFLQRMKRLHALNPGDIQGEWVFPNRLVRLYLLLESSRKETRGGKAR